MTDMKELRENLYQRHYKAFDKLHESEKQDEIKQLIGEIRVLCQSILDKLDEKR